MKTLLTIISAFLFCVSSQGQLYRLVVNGTDFFAVQSGTSSNLYMPTNLVSSTRWMTANTGKLLGRSTAGVGAVEDITLGTGLSFAGTTLNGGAGTVTSVGMTVPTFLSVAGSPVTGAGTLAVTLSGTALPVANGGSGATTLTGIVLGNGAAAFTAGNLTGDITTAGGLATTLKNTGPGVNTFTSVTIDAQGRVTAGSNPSSSVTLDTVGADGASSTIGNGAFTNWFRWTDPGANKINFLISGTNTTASTTFELLGQMTSATARFVKLVESTASTGGSGSTQTMLDIETVASSTASPLRIVVRGTEFVYVDSAFQQFRFADGTAARPPMAFANDSGGGMWNNSGNGTVMISQGGTSMIGVNSGSTGVTLYDSHGIESGLAVLNSGASSVPGISTIFRVRNDSADQSITAIPAAGGNVPTSLHHNSSAVGSVTETLPTWALGANVKFCVRSANALIIKAAGSDVIQVAASTSTATTGNVQSSTIGNFIEVIADVSGKWIASRTIGTWTVN